MSASRVLAGARRVMLPAVFCMLSCLTSKDLPDDVGDLAHLLRSKAGGVERFLVEVLEPGTVGGGCQWR